MPGGLASWLDNENEANAINKCNINSSNNRGNAENPRATRAIPAPLQAQPNRQPLTTMKGAHALEIAIIDVDAEKSNANDREKNGVRVVGSATASDTRKRGETSTCTAPCAQDEPRPWDPFASNSAGDTRSDAFARLLQGSALSAAVHLSPSTPPGRTPPGRTIDQSMTWDPFPDLASDGKENGHNAFSILLPSPSSGAGNGRGGVPGKVQRPSTGKKRKRPAGSSPSNGAAGAGAATRFCECPVCGKRVIIEQCSMHLDTECDGPNTATADASSPLSTGDSQTPGSNPISVEPPPNATCPNATFPSPPPTTPTPVAPSPLLAGAGMAKSALHMLAAIAACPPGEIGAPANNEGEARSKARSVDVATINSASYAPLPVSSGDAVAVAAAVEPAACLTKKSQDIAATAARDGAAPCSATPAAMTTCPVCGEHVLADLCSLHLDTNCTGVNVSPPPAGGRKLNGGVEGAKADGERQTERGGESPSSAAAAEQEDARAGREEVGRGDSESEAAGGLTALAAELTCPVCLCLFEDAHALPCSHRFCLDCINGCFRSSKRQECPLCKVPAWKRDLKRDVPLQNIILAYRRMAK